MNVRVCHISSVFVPLITILQTVFFLPVHAQTVPDLVTDRPDQTESTSVVPHGYYQIETGLVHSSEGGDAVTSVPGTLVRIGLIRDFMEVRVGTDGWTIDHENDTNGYGDSGLSVKMRLSGENGLKPDIAILTAVTLPTGEEGYSSDRYDPEVRFAFAHTLAENVSLGYNVAVSWASMSCGNGDVTTLATFPWSVSLGRSLTERIGSFVEVYGNIPINAYGTPANLFDCGFTCLVLDNLQLDIEGGAGLSEAAEDWFAGAGISYRLLR